MRFLHLSDLHMGKRINGLSLYEDQRYIFGQILDIVREQKLDAVVIAGDVYDKSMPSAEAVELFDDFLTGLSRLDIPVMIISGNHDSPERLAFGGRIMEGRNIHIYSVFDGSLKRVRVKDVDFYLLPFVKPQTVRGFFNRDGLSDYNEMMELILTDFEKQGKSVLVMHQFITAGGDETERGGSETVTVGTLDNIDASHFEQFDYVALGHIHKPQCVGSEKIVYCGSPLKYSFAESAGDKYAVIVDTDKDMKTEKIPLTPLRDMRKIKGELDELLKPEVYECENTEDYLHVTLTDGNGIIDAAGRLRTVYKNVLEIEFDNVKKKTEDIQISAETVRSKTPLELFGSFFEEQNGVPMNEEQNGIIRSIMEDL